MQKENSRIQIGFIQKGSNFMLHFPSWIVLRRVLFIVLNNFSYSREINDNKAMTNGQQALQKIETSQEQVRGIRSLSIIALGKNDHNNATRKVF